MYYVYILKSVEDGKLYIGSTNDLRRRLSEHNNQEVQSTKNRVRLSFVIMKHFILKLMLENENYLSKKMVKLLGS
jgi:putative endonuclease